MSKSFLVKRILQVFILAFTVLSAVYVAKGQPLQGALQDAALWSAISTLIFVGSMFYYRRTNKPCDICVESPQAAGSTAPIPDSKGSKP